MIFNEIFESGSCDHHKKRYHREAVRAVVMQDEKLLMLHTNRGDYKFPGGGIEEQESHEEALVRELLEETGYHAKAVKEKIGLVVERRPDKQDHNMLFEMASHYYWCDVTGAPIAQKLDAYEAELEFRPVWISLDEVVSRNETLLEKSPEHLNIWVERELYVLKLLKEHYNQDKTATHNADA